MENRFQFFLINFYKRLQSKIINPFVAGIVFLLLSFGFCTHPYYVSVTEIEYISDKKEIQIACKLFVDDFEAALKKQGEGKWKLTDNRNASVPDSVIFRYLIERLQILTASKRHLLKWQGKELQRDAIWIYLSVEDVDPPREIVVRNNLLYDYRQDQINIIHMKSGSQKKSARLTYPEKQYTFSIAPY
jgi:hypothetical protein